MDQNEFIKKEPGLNIVKLDPESFFKIDDPRDLEKYHYYFGLLHGFMLKKEIQEMEKYLPDFLQKTRGKFFGKIAYKFLLKKARAIKQYIPQNYLSEMQGVAKGAKVKENFIVLINVFDELKNVYGCSALAIESDKRLLYGANTDYVVFGDFLGPRNTVFIYKHKNSEYSFVSIAWPGYVGLIRGMNDQGTVLLSLTSYSKDQRIKGVPTSFLYREILEKFNGSIPLSAAKRTIGNNILIGNDKKVGVIEVSARHWGNRGPETVEGKKFITATNHYQTNMDQYQRPPKPAKGMTIPKNEEEKWFWNFFGKKGSETRNEKLKREIRACLIKQIKRLDLESHRITPQTIKKILATVANPYATLNSVIFDPANLKLYIANNSGEMPATKGNLIEINIKEALNMPLLNFCFSFKNK